MYLSLSMLATFFLSLFNSTIYLSVYQSIYKWWTQIILDKEFYNFSAPTWPNKQTNWKTKSVWKYYGLKWYYIQQFFGVFFFFLLLSI